MFANYYSTPEISAAHDLRRSEAEHEIALIKQRAVQQRHRDRREQEARIAAFEAQARGTATAGGFNQKQYDILVEALGEVIADLREEIETRLKAAPAVTYAGVWKDSESYPPGAAVTFQGGLWLAKAFSTGQRPNTAHGLWVLVVKSGKA